MSFDSLEIKPVYTTGRNKILEEFYIPVISSSIRYDRAAGYFSSHVFTKIAEGLSAFFNTNQGNMRLIIGGDLSEDDANIISEAETALKLGNTVYQVMNDAIEHMVSEIDRRRLELLSLLIKTGRLEIRFVYKRIGMFHDKFGLFHDEVNNTILFQGSSNETASGYIHNVESITCFKSSGFKKHEHIDHFSDLFEKLWNGIEPGCITIDVPNAIKDKLLNIRISNEIISPEMEKQIVDNDNTKFQNNDLDKYQENIPKIPELYKGHIYSIRPHQKSALDEWKNNNFSGIAELCTGAGKTVMAIHSIVKLYETKKRLFVVISAPYINLADQWTDELKLFNIKALRCYSGNNYRPDLSKAISEYNLGAINFVCLVVVNATLRNDNFYEQLDKITDLYYIADECHHLRNIVKSRSFNIPAKFKLGLSATPLHYFDVEGNLKLCNFFGCQEPFFKYNLSDALNDDVLSRYNYYPIPISLTHDEGLKYKQLTKEIGRMMQANYEDNSYLDNLIRQRTELIATAENKLKILRTLPAIKNKSPLTLFYCGIDSITPTDNNDLRQMDMLSQILFDNNWHTAKYTSKEDTNTRKAILASFRDGSIDALIAMKCLDEGVDIPGCYNAFILASSRDPRQFIQRRGRVLRKSPGKEVANIYDFIVVPPIQESNIEDHDLKLIQNEFERALEFANLANNMVEAKTTLLPLAKDFQLTHLL